MRLLTLPPLLLAALGVAMVNVASVELLQRLDVSRQNLSKGDG